MSNVRFHIVIFATVQCISLTFLSHVHQRLVVKHIAPDYIFPRVPRIATLAVIQIDLSAWDRCVHQPEQITVLQSEEKNFQSRLWQLHSTFPCTVAIALVGQQASHQRFAIIQRR